MKKPFSVNLWGSHPDEDNDDCHTGSDFETLEEAEKAAAEWHTHFHASSVSCTSHVELDGPDIHRVVEVQKLERDVDDDSDWRREMAMEAGMLHGVEAYNDAMGW